MKHCLYDFVFLYLKKGGGKGVRKGVSVIRRLNNCVQRHKGEQIQYYKLFVGDLVCRVCNLCAAFYLLFIDKVYSYQNRVLGVDRLIPMNQNRRT